MKFHENYTYNKLVSWTVILLIVLTAILSCRTLVSEDVDESVIQGGLPPTTTISLATTTPTADLSTVQIITPTSIQPVLGFKGDPYTPELGNMGYDVDHYTIQVAVDPSQLYELNGVTTIEATSTLEGLGQVWLDFIGFEVNKVAFNGTPTTYSRSEAKLIIDLQQSISIGTGFTLEIEYDGKAVLQQSRYVPFSDHIGLFYPDDRSLYVLAEPDGARFWFPCNDHPQDKAAFRFEIAVPEGLTGIANGLLIETRPLDNGDTLFVWEHNHPMATYLGTVVVGDYERVENRSPDGILLRHYLNPENLEDYIAEFVVVGNAIDWLSNLFGPYPFEAFGFVSISGFGASLENQTMVLLDEFMLYEEVLIHEIAHMWFGDWVSIDSWGEIWRNEGFATYLELMWTYRGDRDGLEERMKNMTDSVNQQSGLEPLNNLSPYNLFGYESYVKGAVVVHALRQEMGDDAFFKGLRNYIQIYGGSSASDADFQDVMEVTHGASLDGFFDLWINN
jgi:aminopeptidase N